MKLAPIKVLELSEKVFKYFESHPCKNGIGYVDKDVAVEFASSVLDAIGGEVKSTIDAYYQCPFQTYWINFMRYEAGMNWSSDSSFGFHIDDNPTQLLKIFIYLNDTFESNAAFRTFDYSATNKLVKDGFISCSPELRVK